MGYLIPIDRPHAIAHRTTLMSPAPLVSRIVDIENLFLSGAFAPAPVQRDYQWLTAHCRTLLVDIDRTFAASSLATKSAAADIDDTVPDDDRVDARPVGRKQDGTVARHSTTTCSARWW